MATINFPTRGYVDSKLSEKVNTSSINTTLPSTASDSNVPSTKLLKDQLEGKVNVTAIVDDCETESTAAPLSAKQGKVLMTAIQAMAGGIKFQGTVGEGGTIEWSALPAASSENNGYEYKVITANASNPKCEVGDYIISNGTAWTVDPAVNDSFELKTNKTQSISSESTNTQYPTALAVYTAIKDLEDTAHKTTTISDASTDTQYPTAKAVYTSIAALNAQLSTLNATVLTKTEAASTYLTKTDAGNTYLTQAAAASDYLSKTDAASTYLTQADAESTYLTQDAADDKYLSTDSDAFETLSDTVDTLTTNVGNLTTGLSNTNDVLGDLSDAHTALAGLVDDLDEALDAFKSDVASDYTTKTAFATLEGTVGTLQTKHNALDTTVDGLLTNHNALDARVLAIEADYATETALNDGLTLKADQSDYLALYTTVDGLADTKVDRSEKITITVTDETGADTVYDLYGLLSSSN